LKLAGANVEQSNAGMYLPPVGMTLHKGMSITAFPPELRNALEKFAAALEATKVTRVPIAVYAVKDKKVNIVINRSTDTADEAKQY